MHLAGTRPPFALRRPALSSPLDARIGSLDCEAGRWRCETGSAQGENRIASCVHGDEPPRRGQWRAAGRPGKGISADV